jgi:hypothetical protein
MNIPVPFWLARSWTHFCDWVNEPLWMRARRIDAILLVFGIGCVAYYGYVGGWSAALAGGLMYLFVLMVSLWFMRGQED